MVDRFLFSFHLNSNSKVTTVKNRAIISIEIGLKLANRLQIIMAIMVNSKVVYRKASIAYTDSGDKKEYW